MKNRWNDREARACAKRYASHGEDLALRTYSARLIGQDRALVLHGGGNTSVKTLTRSLTGEAVSVLCVKGSGWDLAAIEPAGHPAVKMDALRPLRALPAVSDEEMVNVLRANMLDSRGPNPSVETLLHAFLPHKFIDHAHADAILAWVDQPDAERLVRRWTHGRLGIVPYIMPGFALAKRAAEIFERDPSVEGLLLLRHGIFTFGQTARESYGRMIYWVDRAERRLGTSTRAISVGRARSTASKTEAAQAAAILRGALAPPFIVRHRATPACLSFLGRPDLIRAAQRGPATPDHVIRTKGIPLLLPRFRPERETAFRRTVDQALAGYARKYDAYFDRQCRAKSVARTKLDPWPRLFLVPGLGAFAAGEDAAAADIALDILDATIAVVTKAERIGRYRPVGEGDRFDMEYWSLEQAKLGARRSRPFDGKIAWISGAASGIGLATARAFVREGAHVFLMDRDARALTQAVAELKAGPRAACCAGDVTRPADVAEAFVQCAAAFGGVDIVVSNAGAAFTSPIDGCSERVLRDSFELNFFSHQDVARRAVEIFRRQNRGGALLFNASKSAFNPGPEFGPYTLPKAGVIALMKQYAVELGPIGVRSNAVNADRVRTRLFSEKLLAERARARGVSVERYLAGNLLGREVWADDVAQAFLYLARAEKTTGAVLPVDGGNAAAFPR